MATAPQTTTARLTRDKLAKFLPTHEAIKAFESLTSDVTQVLPAASLANAISAANAGDAAEAGIVAAAAAQLTADAALAQAGVSATDPSMGALWAEISKLRARVAALEQGTNP